MKWRTKHHIVKGDSVLMFERVGPPSEDASLVRITVATEGGSAEMYVSLRELRTIVDALGQDPDG